MKVFGEDIFGYKLCEIIKEVDVDQNGMLEFNEFLEVSFDFLFGKCLFFQNLKVEMCV